MELETTDKYCICHTHTLTLTWLNYALCYFSIATPDTRECRYQTKTYLQAFL